METQSSIYAKTYNFVYLRAKSILEKEDDIQQLMKEVYVQALEQEIKEEKLYSWLGRQVYILGCGKFRKKKAREADYIELDKQQYAASKTVDMEKTIEVICDTLDELPDMYRATLYAFYYDHMKVKEIAAATGYSAGVIINRINYTHKYLEKALELYAEEQKAKVQFSVEAVVLALTNWTENHCLSQQVAQNIYGSICRELGVQTEVIETEDKGGCEHRVREYDGDIVTELSEEFAAYQPKNKREIEPRFAFEISLQIIRSEYHTMSCKNFISRIVELFFCKTLQICSGKQHFITVWKHIAIIFRSFFLCFIFYYNFIGCILLLCCIRIL